MPEGDGNVDTLAQAATSTVQGMTPQMQGPLTQFGPSPLVAPPLPVTMQTQPQVFSKPQGSFATVGERKRADRQAILQNTAQLVKSGADMIQQKKFRALSMDIHSLMEASQGRQEAMQALQQNPNDQQAKAALERNTQIINTITGDPKKSKLIQKAFNVDLFGGGKNQKENAAMIDAWKNFNQKQQQGDKSALNPQAERLMQSQPSRLQLSPEAQQQAAMVKMGLIPGADKIIQANTEVYKSLQTAKSAEDRDAALTRAAQIRADAEDKHTGALLDAANMRVLGQANAAAIASKARMFSAQKAYEVGMARVQAMKDVANTKNANPIFKQLFQQKQSVTNELGKLIQENKGYETELGKKGSTLFGLYKFDAHSSAEERVMRIKIDTNNKIMKDLQQQQSVIDQRMGVLNKLGIDTGQGEAPAESGSVNVPDSDVPEE